MASPSPALLPAGFRLETRDEAHGRTRLLLRPDDHWLDAIVPCQLTIDPLELALGAGEQVLAGAGIGNVETHPDHRRRGLARQLLAVADGVMREQGAQVGLLYGIDGFYGRLGWRGCGGERWVEVERDHRALGSDGGLRVRRMLTVDLPALTQLYDVLARASRGAALRPAGGRVWSRLDPADVLVCLDDEQRLVGWAWRGAGRLAERDAVAKRRPGVDVWAELHGATPEAVRAVLAAVLDTRPGGKLDDAPVLTGAPDGHLLRELGRAGEFACRIIDEHRPDGGAMVKPLAPGIDAPANLYQFLPDRF